MTSSSLKLVAGVIFCALAAWFSMVYNAIASSRFHQERPGGVLPSLNESLVAMGYLGWLIPLVVLVLGGFLLRSGRSVGAEATCYAGVLLSLVLIGLSLLAWQVAYVPTFHPHP